MSTNSQSIRPGFVIDPHTGKRYNLNPLLQHLSEDGTPLEELHYQIIDAMHDLLQAVDFERHPPRLIQNALFLLYQLERSLRPKVIFSDQPKS